ncbi:MAG: hypothetical protein ACLPV8_16560 [Steroidobacteraceae bacterium]
MKDFIFRVASCRSGCCHGYPPNLWTYRLLWALGGARQQPCHALAPDRPDQPA